LRFPKASVADNDIDPIDRIGGMDVLRRDDDADVLVVSAGAVAPLALEVADRVAAQGVGVTVVDPRWVLPVDGALPALAAAHALVVTIEDNGRAGGIGDAVARELRSRSITTPVRSIALPQEFLPTGRRDDLLRELGLSAKEIARAAIESVSQDLHSIAD
jgi:1-deoxy-D-xylulose-5-phosphate synthase